MDRQALRAAVQHLAAGDWQAAHGIVHIMEGDLPNARYWYGLAKREFPQDLDVKAEVAALRAAAG